MSRWRHHAETVLGYDGGSATPLPAARYTVLFWIPMSCWLLPLLIGLGITVALEIVRALHSRLPSRGSHDLSYPFDLLVPGAALNVLAGTLLAGIGCVMVLAFALTRWSVAVDRWSSLNNSARLSRRRWVSVLKS